MLALEDVLDRLAELYGEPAIAPRRSVLELLWLENVVYLADDGRREAAFQALRKKVGTEPERVLEASDARLREIASEGILADNQVAKLRRIARLAKDLDLDGVPDLPLRDAKRVLMKFPSIGEPGAEKILMFARTHAVLGLDSNGVRVVTRLGLVNEDKSYARTYKGVQAWAEAYVAQGTEWLIRAHQLLRQHGQELCRRSRPRCEQCPLRDGCRYYAGAVR